MLAPSANISSQFVLDMERYAGMTRSPDLQRFASIGPSHTVLYSLRVLASRQHLHDYTLGGLCLAAAAAAHCSPIQCLVHISPLEMLSTVALQQKTFLSRWNGSVRVDVLCQRRQRHPGGRLLRARRQGHASRHISPFDRRFPVSSRAVGFQF